MLACAHDSILSIPDLTMPLNVELSLSSLLSCRRQLSLRLSQQRKSDFHPMARIQQLVQVRTFFARDTLPRTFEALTDTTMTCIRRSKTDQSKHDHLFSVAATQKPEEVQGTLCQHWHVSREPRSPNIAASILHY